jgi:hypothetical protein
MEALLILISLIYVWAALRFIAAKEILGPYGHGNYLLRRPIIRPTRRHPFGHEWLVSSRRSKLLSKFLKHTLK